MLEVSPEAAALIEELVEDAALGAEAGLRICVPEASLSMEIAPYPEEDDVVMDQHGVRVFLSPRAEERTHDLLLESDERHPAFFLRAPAAPAAPRRRLRSHLRR